MKISYEDMISRPHHVSTKHPRMSMMERAGQFSPFAALTGYGDALKETARLTDRRVELDEYEKAELNQRLQNAAKNKFSVDITYFVPDAKKQGGAYVVVTGTIKRIDEPAGTVKMVGGNEIKIEDIYKIESENLDSDF